MGSEARAPLNLEKLFTFLRTGHVTARKHMLRYGCIRVVQRVVKRMRGTRNLRKLRIIGTFPWLGTKAANAAQ